MLAAIAAATLATELDVAVTVADKISSEFTLMLLMVAPDPTLLIVKLLSLGEGARA